MSVGLVINKDNGVYDVCFMKHSLLQLSLVLYASIVVIA